MYINILKMICKKLSYQYGVINPPALIPMKYSRMGKSVILGYYDHDENAIAVNKYAIDLLSPNEIVDIIKHELIHAKCYQVFGHGGHGKHFKKLCTELGVDKEIALAQKKGE